MRKDLLGGVLALGLIFTGCSADDILTPEGSKISEVDQTLYVNMTIHGDNPSTRAGESFSEGTDQENAVNNAYFVFYDEDGQVVGDIVPVTLSDSKTGTNGTVNEFYKSVVPVSVRKGEKKPSGVICYINPVSPSSLQNPLSVIQTVSRERVTSNINGQNFFAMSNSVYYPAEAPNPPAADAVPQVMVPIDTDAQLFNTEAEAEEAEGGEIVDVYVERYATKLTFTPQTAGNNNVYETNTRVFGATEAEYTNTPVTLEFVPQYWALNAQCNNTYVVKSFRRETQSGEIMADNYPYNILNYRLNISDPQTPLNDVINNSAPTTGQILGSDYAWSWNDATNHRSFWSMSPAYFQDVYPVVAEDVENVNLPNQDYLAYKDLPTKGYAYGTDAFTNPHYFKETTVGTKAINSSNPAAAVASVIYVGQYKLTVNGNPVPGTGNVNFYTYLTGSVTTTDGKTEQRPYIYFDAKADGSSAVEGGESMLKRFCAQSTILYTYNATTKEYEELNLSNYSKFVAALEVSEISDEVKKAVDGTSTTKLKLQANARSLQFKGVEQANAQGIYIASGNGYKTLVADNATPTSDQIRISEANSILMQQVGYAYYYDLGKAYFNIPVKHYGWYRAGNTQKDNAKINWNLVRVGDFGMVRNHEYQVVVNKIEGLASGINGDDTPIVPPAATDDYFVSYQVNILKWAVVPQQEVNL